MRYFDTFSGIGGFPLGIQLAYESKVSVRNGQTKNRKPTPPESGMESAPESILSNRSISNSELRRDTGEVSCIGYSEIDKYASKIYQSHFPNHQAYGDITKINTDELPDFDLLVGGFPCQTFSIAGKRAGFEDTRGTMFFELARILRAKQPRLFVFENVKGLLSHDNGNTFKTIIQTLDELGYDCQWQVLNSKNHGVPQNRERIFIIGNLRGTPRPQVFPFRETTVKNLGDCSISNTSKREFGFKSVSPALLSRDYKDPKLVQINHPTHSNDRVYDTEGISHTLNTMQGGNRQPFVNIPEATKQGYAVATEGDSINLSVPSSKTRRGRVGKGVAQTLDTGMQQHTLQNSQIRRLTPTECERLQGFPDGWTDGISDSQRYKCLGNAVTVNVIRDIFEQII